MSRGACDEGLAVGGLSRWITPKSSKTQTMKKLLLITIVSLLLPCTAFPGKVPVQVAEQVAMNFASLEIQSQFDHLILAKTITRNDIPLCYIFNFPDGRGHIAVAADDRVHPVLYYNNQHIYRDTDDFPLQYTAWMNSYLDQVEYVIQHDLPAGQNNEDAWQAMLHKTPMPGRGTTAVTPLLTTTWNQNCYYNGACPEDAAGPCGRALAGCGATAMAQVMKYHNWPAIGKGYHSYYEPDYGTLSADFGNTVYNWAGMPNNLSSSNANVATLLYHCGVSIDMDYGPYSSYSYATDIADALGTYFSYNPGCMYYYKDNYSVTTWENMLKDDLDNSQPIVYRGTGNYGGHLFVCDGYSGTNYFHFNWGWSGTYNGYYYLNNLNPGQYTFTDGQGAILDVYPLNSSPCTTVTPVSGCGSGFAQTFAGGGSGIWFSTTSSPCGTTSPGKEKIYSYLAPVTGIYSIQVTAASGIMNYLWKTGSCGSTGWTCIDDINAPGQYGAMSWNAGTTYYILLDDANGNTGNHTFYINCAAPAVPATRTLQNMTITNGQSVCYDATQTISTAGSGTNFTVQSGGELFLVSGQNILLLPGTLIQSGSYMTGTITIDNFYCNGPAAAE